MPLPFGTLWYFLRSEGEPNLLCCIQLWVAGLSTGEYQNGNKRRGVGGGGGCCENRAGLLPPTPPLSPLDEFVKQIHDVLLETSCDTASFQMRWSLNGCYHHMRYREINSFTYDLWMLFSIQVSQQENEMKSEILWTEHSCSTHNHSKDVLCNTKTFFNSSFGR